MSCVHFSPLYNDQWQLLEERKDGDADPVGQYVWHPYYIDALAVRYYDANADGDYLDPNEGAHYYCQDANYNVTAIVNASGTVLERYTYTPYGEVTFLDPSFGIRASSLINNTHLYTGRELDIETGLQLNRNRYYASHLGRWVNRDPIGYGGGTLSLYEYIKGRPILFLDPSGLELSCEEKCALKLAAWSAGCTALAVNHAIHCETLAWNPVLFAACLASVGPDLAACNLVGLLLYKKCMNDCEEEEECPASPPPSIGPCDDFSPGSERPPGMPPPAIGCG